jgi:hypothetical protein
MLQNALELMKVEDIQFIQFQPHLQLVLKIIKVIMMVEEIKS